MDIDREFIAACYLVLLGREPESDEVCVALAHHPRDVMLRHFIGSPEFQVAVIDPLAAARLPPLDRFTVPLGRIHRFWAADRLPLAEPTRDAVVAAADWWDLLRLLLADAGFMGAGGRAPVIVPPLPTWLVEERFERLERARRP